MRSRDPQQMAASKDVLRSVVDRNPDFSGGYSALAKAGYLTASDRPDDMIRDMEDARDNARAALELDPQSVEALKVMAVLASSAGERFDYIDRAVVLDPGDAEAWLWYSHIAAHPDYPGEELRAMQRLIALDPLWGRSWQASYVAAAEDGMELAENIDRAIIAAASQQWQSDAAEARIRNLHGDVSEFYRLTLQAMPAMAMEHRQIAGMQLSNSMLLLGLDMTQPKPPGAAGVVQDVLFNRLPAREAFAESGLVGESFWRIPPLVIGAPPQFLRQGRGDELLALYDATFDSPEALEAFAEQRLRPHHFIPQTATYVGYAMREAGRYEEASALFDLAERSIARWRENDGMTMTPTLFEANLAAALGQRDRAIDAVSRLPQHGYPYVLQSPGVPLTGPLVDDPLWDDLQADPRLIEILAPIRANLARERAEVEALMRG